MAAFSPKIMVYSGQTSQTTFYSIKLSADLLRQSLSPFRCSWDSLIPCHNCFTSLIYRMGFRQLFILRSWYIQVKHHRQLFFFKNSPHTFFCNLSLPFVVVGTL